MAESNRDETVGALAILHSFVCRRVFTNQCQVLSKVSHPWVPVLVVVGALMPPGPEFIL